MNKLYKLFTKEKGNYWVVAEDPTSAELNLQAFFNKSDVRYRNVKVTRIDLIATETDYMRFIEEHNLLVKDYRSNIKD